MALKCKVDIKKALIKKAVKTYETGNIKKVSPNTLFVSNALFKFPGQSYQVAQSLLKRSARDYGGKMAYVVERTNGHEVVFEPGPEIIEEYYESYLLKVNTEQARAMLKEDAERAGEDFDDDYLFQVDDVLTNLEKVQKRLKGVNKVVKSIGSNKKLDAELKRVGMAPEFRKQFISILDNNPSLKQFRVSEVLSIYSKEIVKEADRQYYQAVQEPLDKKLEALLIDYFSDFKIRNKEIDNLKEKFGVDSVGVFDVLAKTIYYAKNRNLLTLPEEYGHAFVELLGSISKKKSGNQLFTFMFNEIEKWDGYERVFNQYKDIYKTSEGNIDIYKIKKEAVGQAIGIALVRNYKAQQDSEFWSVVQRIIDFISDILAKLSYSSIEREADLIAKDILAGDKSKLKRLKKDTSDFNLLSYTETIETQNAKDGGRALGFMKWFSDWGNIITGSLAYRLQGTVYRPMIDALHDIDMIVPSDIHGLSLDKRDYMTEEQLQNDAMYRKLVSEGNFKEAKKYKIQGNMKLVMEDIVDKSDYFKKILKKYPDMDMLYTFYNQKANAYYITVNAIWSENQELKDRFKSLTGSFNDRLEHFTEEEIDQMYLFDFFLRPETSEEYISVPDPDYGLKLAHFNYAFYEKLNMMGRPKDAYDYQMWDYFDEDNILAPDFNDRLVYFQALESDSANNAKDENENKIMQDLNDLNFTEDAIRYLYGFSSKTMDLEEFGKQTKILSNALAGNGYNNQDILDKLKCL